MSITLSPNKSREPAPKNRFIFKLYLEEPYAFCCYESDRPTVRFENMKFEWLPLTFSFYQFKCNEHSILYHLKKLYEEQNEFDITMAMVANDGNIVNAWNVINAKVITLNYKNAIEEDYQKASATIIFDYAVVADLKEGK